VRGEASSPCSPGASASSGVQAEPFGGSLKPPSPLGG